MFLRAKVNFGIPDLHVQKRFPTLVLFTILAISCSQPLIITRYDNQQYQFTSSNLTGYDTAIDNTIKPYRDSLKSSMSSVVARTAAPLIKTELGNFVADACVRQLHQRGIASFDFLVFNRGGLRRTLPAGDILQSDIFELMPFDNSLVIVTLDGSATYALCRQLARNGNDPVAGISIMPRPGDAFPDILIGGVPFDSTRSYSVATNYYMANGGDHFDMFLKRQKMDNTGILVRDLLMDYCKETAAAGRLIEPDYNRRIEK